MRDHEPRVQEGNPESLGSMEPLCHVSRVAPDELVWIPSRNLGYYPVKAGIAPYDKDYFDRYAEMSATFMGRHLTHARVDFVGRHHSGMLVDIGIGSGAFIIERIQRGSVTYGHDVNPVAVDWLRNKSLYCQVPRPLTTVPAVSLWDVFEHIPNYGPLLAAVEKYVFMSIPIFKGPEHVLSSKHFRRDEHCWYFTNAGLVYEMYQHGFALAEHNTDEVKLGREDIGSFAFRRVRKALL